MTRIIRTVDGDIAPDKLGVGLGHEHLVAHPPAVVKDPDLFIEDEAEARDDLTRFREAGGDIVVEMTTVDYGRDAPALRRLSRSSGVHIVAATGFNQAKFADRVSSRFATDRIAGWMIDEVTGAMLPPGAEDLDEARPIDPDAPRAGLVKASSSLDGPTADERRVFDAAIAAFHATGAPISTHTEKGTFAAEQVGLLIGGGVPPDKILIGHLDLRPDLGFLVEMARTGVYLGLDQFGKSKYLGDDARLRLVAELAGRGFARQIVLSGDIARRSGRSVNGGPGLCHLPLTLSADLARIEQASGAREPFLLRNLVDFLAFTPRPDPSTKPGSP